MSQIRYPLQRIVDFFETMRVPYVVLGDFRTFPAHIAGDVDILVSKSSFARVHALARAICQGCNLYLLSLHHHSGDGITCYFSERLSLKAASVVAIDFTSDVYADGRKLLRSNLVLDRRVLITTDSGLAMYVPSPDDAFIYYLTKKATKSIIEKPAVEYLRYLLLEQQADVKSRIVVTFGDELADQIIAHIETRDVHQIAALLPIILAHLHAHLRPQFAYFASEFRRFFHRSINPTGLFVSVIGPDGSGKTTLISSMSDLVCGTFKTREYFHFRPGVIARPRTSKPSCVDDPHASRPHSAAKSLLKLFVLVADYICGYMVRTRPRLTRSSLVIYDRYFQDILVDPKRYRYGGSMMVVRTMELLVPRPEIMIVLDAPASVVQHRKSEVPFDETARQSEAYKALASARDFVYVVDASLGASIVLDSVDRLLATHLVNRTRKRYL